MIGTADRGGLARSGAISLAGSAFAATAALALTLLIGNGLGASGTGVFFQAVGIFTVLTQMLKLGTNSGIIRELARQRAHDERGGAWRTVLIALVPVVVVSVVVAVVVGLFAEVLAGWLGPPQQRDDLTVLLRDLAPYLVVASAMSVLQTASRMVRGVGTFTLLQNVLLPASRLIAAGAVLVLGWGALSAFRGWLLPLPVWLVATIVVVAVPLVRDVRDRSPGGAGWRRSSAAFWRFSAARGVGAALETVFEWADVLLVAALASPADAGVYAVVTRTVRAGQVVDRAMRIAASPTISGQLARDDVDAARTLHTRVARTMILATWPFYLVLALSGAAVLQLFGPEFVRGAGVLAVLAAVTMITTAAGMLQSILLQGGRSSWQVGNKAVAVVLIIGLNVLLLPPLGLLGAAIAWSVAVAADTALAAWQVHRRMGVRLEPARLVSAAVPALVVFGAGGLIVRALSGDAPLPAALGSLALGLLYLGWLWLDRHRLGLDPVWALLLPRRGRPRQLPPGTPEAPPAL